MVVTIHVLQTQIYPIKLLLQQLQVQEIFGSILLVLDTVKQMNVVIQKSTREMLVTVHGSCMITQIKAHQTVFYLQISQIQLMIIQTVVTQLKLLMLHQVPQFIQTVWLWLTWHRVETL